MRASRSLLRQERAASLRNVRVPRSICAGFLLSQEWRSVPCQWIVLRTALDFRGFYTDCFTFIPTPGILFSGNVRPRAPEEPCPDTRFASRLGLRIACPTMAANAHVGTPCFTLSALLLRACVWSTRL